MKFPCKTSRRLKVQRQQNVENRKTGKQNSDSDFIFRFGMVKWLTTPTRCKFMNIVMALQWIFW